MEIVISKKEDLIELLSAALLSQSKDARIVHSKLLEEQEEQKESRLFKYGEAYDIIEKYLRFRVHGQDLPISLLQEYHCQIEELGILEYKYSPIMNPLMTFWKIQEGDKKQYTEHLKRFSKEFAALYVKQMIEKKRTSSFS